MKFYTLARQQQDLLVKLDFRNQQDDTDSDAQLNLYEVKIRK